MFTNRSHGYYNALPEGQMHFFFVDRMHKCFGDTMLILPILPIPPNEAYWTCPDKYAKQHQFMGELAILLVIRRIMI